MRPAVVAILLVLAAGDVGRGVETLQQAWGAATAGNAGLLSARLEADAAQHGVGAAASEWHPAASLRTGYHYLSSEPKFVGNQPAFSASTFAFPNAQRNAASFSVRASQPLWTGGRIDNSIAAAKSRHSASEQSSEWLAMQLRMAVAEAYLAVLKANASLFAAQETHKATQVRDADVTERARQRRATDTEVMASRVVLMEAQQQVLTAQSVLSSANAAYNQLLGRPSTSPVELVEPQLATDQRTLEEATAHAAANRPDLIELRRTVRSHEHDAAFWRASSRPQLSAEAGFDYEQNRFRSPEGIGVMGVFVDWSLADGGKKRRLSAASSSRAAAARAALADRQSQVAVEVLQSWNQRAEALGAERVSGEALAHRVEDDRHVQQRYSEGLVVAADSLASRAAVAEAQALHQQARLNRIAAEVRFRFVSGALARNGN